jgi:predicted amidophosphoribosyltransferase
MPNFCYNLLMSNNEHCPECRKPLVIEDFSCANCGQEFCPECLSAIDFDADHCGVCGATFEVFCPACENQIDPAAVFCRNCGQVFEKNRPVLVPEYLNIPLSNKAASDETEVSETEEADDSLLEDEDEANTIPCPECESPIFI